VSIAKCQREFRIGSKMDDIENVSTNTFRINGNEIKTSRDCCISHSTHYPGTLYLNTLDSILDVVWLDNWKDKPSLWTWIYDFRGIRDPNPPKWVVISQKPLQVSGLIRR